jgi:hypothetical protein
MLAGGGEAHDAGFGHAGDPRSIDEFLTECGAERAGKMVLAGAGVAQRPGAAAGAQGL